jgi:GntR family transcriptional repressor for pyruvate dehydrogenase complex
MSGRHIPPPATSRKGPGRPRRAPEPEPPVAGPATVERLRQSNVADLVASALRRRILDGDLADGSLLPKQEELSLQFGTSAPSVREGLRILEGEGLVTVRRGRLGGAVVHAPAGGSAAYMLGLVFEARNVTLREVGDQLNSLEPICAGLCAQRKDRRKTVVPRLRAIHNATMKETALVEGTRLGRQFHEELVRSCGRETMVVLIGVLESIWSAHSELSAVGGSLARVPPSQEYFAERTNEHEELISLIDAGDADGAVACARRHLEASTFYRSGDAEPDRTVQADLLARYLDTSKG